MSIDEPDYRNLLLQMTITMTFLNLKLYTIGSGHLNYLYTICLIQ
jgi:hypothetical protein